MHVQAIDRGQQGSWYYGLFSGSCRFQGEDIGSLYAFLKAHFIACREALGLATLGFGNACWGYAVTRFSTACASACVGYGLAGVAQRLTWFWHQPLAACESWQGISTCPAAAGRYGCHGSNLGNGLEFIARSNIAAVALIST